MDYAYLCAEKYYRQGKKTTFINLFFSPTFTFIKNYFFNLGFLDGWQGFMCAKMSAWYTFLKYTRLKEMQQAEKEVQKEMAIYQATEDSINKIEDDGQVLKGLMIYDHSEQAGNVQLTVAEYGKMSILMKRTVIQIKI